MGAVRGGALEQTGTPAQGGEVDMGGSVLRGGLALVHACLQAGKKGATPRHGQAQGTIHDAIPDRRHLDSYSSSCRHNGHPQPRQAPPQEAHLNIIMTMVAVDVLVWLTMGRMMSV